MDGARPVQILRDITLPLLRPIIALVVLLRAIDAFKEFDKVFILTGGGPGTATELLSIYTYRMKLQGLGPGLRRGLRLHGVLRRVDPLRGLLQGVFWQEGRSPTKGARRHEAGLAHCGLRRRDRGARHGAGALHLDRPDLLQDAGRCLGGHADLALHADSRPLPGGLHRQGLSAAGLEQRHRGGFDHAAVARRRRAGGLRLRAPPLRRPGGPVLLLPDDPHGAAHRHRGAHVPAVHGDRHHRSPDRRDHRPHLLQPFPRGLDDARLLRRHSARGRRGRPDGRAEPGRHLPQSAGSHGRAGPGGLGHPLLHPELERVPLRLHPGGL